MRIKRWISVLLCMLLCVGMLPTIAFAADETDTWDGTTDISWYDAEQTEFHITTAEQLAGLATIVNGKTDTFAGKTVYLENNLDLAGHEWTAIGEQPVQPANPTNYFSPFCGNFDGQNHEIKNMTTTSVKDHNMLGLFGGVSGGTISNLKITNANIVNTEEMYVGLLVGWTYQATIVNCSTSGTLTTTSLGGTSAGGLIGVSHNGTKIIGCFSSATIIDYVTEWTGNYIGGIVGMWTHTDDLEGLIQDCYFNGQIIFSENSDPTIGQTGFTGGILGYHYQYGNNTGDVTINNCMVTTSIIENAYTKTGQGNQPVWIMYNESSKVPQNCYWPDSADMYPAVVDLASNSTTINNCGKSIQDFTDISLLNILSANADSNVTWIMGIEHPTFSWDENNISADYTAVDAAIAKAEALSKDEYKDFSKVEAAINAVVYGKNITEQAEVNEMAQAIEDAIAALEYKDADYTKVDEAIAKAETLNPDDYTNFSTVESAINAIIRGKNITEQNEVDAMAQAIEDAISALKYKAADYSAVDAAIEKVKALNKDGYENFSTVEAAVNAVVWDKNITEQAEVDAMAQAIEDAIDDLEEKQTTVPTKPTVPNDSNDSNQTNGATSPKTDDNQTDNTTSPKTGDNSNIALWIAVTLFAGAVLTGTAIYSRKRKYNR